MYIGFAVAIAVFGSGITYRWQVVAVTGAITIAMAIDDILDLNWLSKLGAYGFWSMMAFLAVLTVGFIYEWKKGALEWD